jgi:SNF2 family DNA or RNA helicase
MNTTKTHAFIFTQSSQHFQVVQNYLVSRRLYMSGGLSGSSEKDSTVEVRIKIAKEVKSQLDEMFSKMETEQTTEEAQKLLSQFLATGLMTTQLMEFQSAAITWMIDREVGNRPSPFYEDRVERGQRVCFCSVTNSSSPIAPEPVRGGILADDMGLGKTLSTLALVATMKCFQPSRKGTLVICPLSVMSNWSDQINSHFQCGALSVYIHHGSSRDSGALDKFDVVISS